MDESPDPPSKHRRLGALLKEARKKAGIRQTELAALLGKGQAFVSKYESGASGLDAVDFIRILELTNGDLGRVVAAMRPGPKE